MKKSKNILAGFLRTRLTKGSSLRALSFLTLSLGTSLSVIYVNHYNYWKGTIYRTQTVDFNILSNLLPSKLSVFLSKKNLSTDDIIGIKQILDSNYGLFGIIVTNCKSEDLHCPNQKILYASKTMIKESKGANQKLIPENSYAKVWSEKFNKDNSSEKSLIESPFVILRNPPPLYQEWRFETPNDDKQVYSKYKNSGTIIGRAYFLRAEKPSFRDDLQKWVKEIPSILPNNSGKVTMSSRNLVYSSIAISTIIAGLLVFIAMEFAYYSTRLAQENEAKAVKDKLNTDQKLRSAFETVRQANLEKIEAEEIARITAEKSERAIQEKLETEEAARAINQQAIREKLLAEEAARIAGEKSEQAIQDKQKAEEDARIAAEKSERAIREKREAEEAARAINQQAIREKLVAEEDARAAGEKSRKAIQDKQKAEEDARIAAEKSKQAIHDKQKAEEDARIASDEREKARRSERDLYDSIDENTKELAKKIESLEKEKSALESRSVREIIYLPELPKDLETVIQYQKFFYWIDSEPRVTHSVESWLKNHSELRSLVEDNDDGHTYLNALGNLLFDITKQIQADRPQVKWPSSCALPPSKKDGVSEVEHRRPHGWERFVRHLCEIDCVKRVAYDRRAYNGNIVNVIDAQSGVLGVRYGSADLFLPLRVETTAYGEEQLKLVMEYIRNHAMN
jgi:hypothetical protein